LILKCYQQVNLKNIIIDKSKLTEEQKNPRKGWLRAEKVDLLKGKPGGNAIWI
jgi:hypothetical protein